MYVHIYTHMNLYSKYPFHSIPSLFLMSSILFQVLIYYSPGLLLISIFSSLLSTLHHIAA